MKTVRAKFICTKSEDPGPAGHKTVILHPVYSTDPESENKRFWDATPNGELRMYLTNPSLKDHFQIGKQYYLDIIEADNE